MICDHAVKCPEAEKCAHGKRHDRNDMCGSNKGEVRCTHINKVIVCLADTEQERFQDWWTDTYKGKLGPTLIEHSFKEVAWKTWEARAAHNEFVAWFFGQQQDMTKDEAEAINAAFQQSLQDAPESDTEFSDEDRCLYEDAVCSDCGDCEKAGDQGE